jgi:hypothetical protein
MKVLRLLIYLDNPHYLSSMPCPKALVLSQKSYNNRRWIFTKQNKIIGAS